MSGRLYPMAYYQTRRQTKRRERMRGDGGYQIFRGIAANTPQLTIALTSGKIEGATVLFGQSTAQFGARAMRLSTRQRSRGNIENPRSGNTARYFLTGSIDALMRFDDATNTWINCALKHVRNAFWHSMDVVRISRGGEFS